MRQEDGNNLCGYYVCEFIHGFVRPDGPMTPEELEVFQRLDLIIICNYNACISIFLI